ncbi:AtpZ/AtpI family protein [Brevibacillus marinus]|uniref:AtpZ/AtpI family protein n=1 Tax=Brevibacillus marinus TaxID=2496837 RepID=UPI000F84954D|nr:AtpZ/AtpI family protein [Brevibacillus marinus]
MPKPRLDNPWQAIALVSVIGVDLAICVLAGFWVGRYLDRWLQTDPWLMLLGMLAGLAAGVYSVYLLIRSYL